MKQTVATVAILVVAIVLCGVILLQVGSTTTQRREKGYAAAEQMVRRISEGADNACRRAQLAKTDCWQWQLGARIAAQRIRELSVDGNEFQLAIATHVLQNYEAERETMLKRLAPWLP